ncbi:uncharacterized protein NPIL_526711 [Nephila pilipes]|uniref:Uncharacterized protein n=1 Tax=Nephila pilipes TaxID=299642 RepID=A0A8X6MPL6_NEPPI|nr:uncharacterized protein NPIL_526711 [Nephila pilipes]
MWNVFLITHRLHLSNKAFLHATDALSSIIVDAFDFHYGGDYVFPSRTRFLGFGCVVVTSGLVTCNDVFHKCGILLIMDQDLETEAHSVFLMIKGGNRVVGDHEVCLALSWQIRYRLSPFTKTFTATCLQPFDLNSALHGLLPLADRCPHYALFPQSETVLPLQSGRIYV